jgi:hypothetical protein
MWSRGANYGVWGPIEFWLREADFEIFNHFFVRWWSNCVHIPFI